MKKLFSLGKLYVSDFLNPDEQPKHPSAEMKLMLDDNGSVRLDSQPPAQQMWGKYWYRSGGNNSMIEHLKGVVESILSIYKLEAGECLLDIACNDGTLLSHVPKNILRVGIDPCEDSFLRESEKHSDLIIQDYFSAKAIRESRLRSDISPRVITCISMFYDLQNPDSFLKDVHEVLHEDGVFIVQMSHTPLMIKQMAFDNFCHEHFFYYSLFNFKSLVERNGFKVLDCQLNDCNGGSFRVYMMKSSGNEKLFGKQPYRDVCKMRIDSLLEYEKTMKMDSVETWTNFYDDINKLKQTTVNFIRQEKAKGKTIYGYGASTKGNSLLQYFGLDNTLITAIAERSPYKFGLKTVGSNIPIIDEAEMRSAKPNYLLILPWHFLSEFVDREKNLLKAGTKFIVPCPKFEVIGL